MRKAKIISVAVVVVMIISVSYFYLSGRQSERGIVSTVSRVIDGDTLEMANGDVVRLIGIDAPEKTQLHYKDAIEQLKKIEGKSVRMEKDATNKDRYGRYLRYVFLEDHFVNLELLQNGLAYAYIVNPDKRYEKEFLEAENLARANGLGIWSRSDYSDCFELESFHYNAKGEDDKNLSDEFFVIKNSCRMEISASKWTVRNTFNSFDIPDFSLDPVSKIKIISGTGKNSNSEVFIGSARPIWNNKGDVLYLRDEGGSVILEKSYKNE